MMPKVDKHPASPVTAQMEKILRTRYFRLYDGFLVNGGTDVALVWINLLMDRTKRDGFYQRWRAGITDELALLLSAEQPPASLWDVENIGWSHGECMGVYMKMAFYIGNDKTRQHHDFAYIGSATAMIKTTGGFVGLAARRYKHESNIKNLQNTNRLDNIIRKSPKERILRFTTLWHSDIDLESADKDSLYNARCDTLLSEAILSSWLNAYDPLDPKLATFPVAWTDPFPWSGTCSHLCLNEGIRAPSFGVTMKKEVYLADVYKKMQNWDEKTKEENAMLISLAETTKAHVRQRGRIAQQKQRDSWTQEERDAANAKQKKDRTPSSARSEERRLRDNARNRKYRKPRSERTEEQRLRDNQRQNERYAAKREARLAKEAEEEADGNA